MLVDKEEYPFLLQAFLLELRHFDPQELRIFNS